jgi:hypothetical protein
LLWTIAKDSISCGSDYVTKRKMRSLHLMGTRNATK